VTDIGEHSSLLRYGKNYCRKKFYSTGPTQCFKNKLDFFKTTLSIGSTQAVAKAVKLVTVVNYGRKLFMTVVSPVVEIADRPVAMMNFTTVNKLARTN
jgi:hypothetical protein